MQKFMQPMLAATLTTSLIWLTACATTSQVSDKNRFLAQTHYDIAITSFETGDLRESLRELLKTVELNPQLPEAHNALGMVYHALEHLDGEHEGVDGPEDLVQVPDVLLVVQENPRVELRHALRRALHDQLLLALVHSRPHFLFSELVGVSGVKDGEHKEEPQQRSQKHK